MIVKFTDQHCLCCDCPVQEWCEVAAIEAVACRQIKQAVSGKDINTLEEFKTIVCDTWHLVRTTQKLYVQYKKAVYEDKTCPICGGVFRPNRNSQVYCSKACCKVARKRRDTEAREQARKKKEREAKKAEAACLRNIRKAPKAKATTIPTKNFSYEDAAPWVQEILLGHAGIFDD